MPPATSDRTRKPKEPEAASAWREMPAGLREAHAPIDYSRVSRPVVVVSDVHLPFHDRELIARQAELARAVNAGLFVINGDLFDFYQLSRFEKDPDLSPVAKELEAGRKYGELLRRTLPADCEVVWVEGNHDERFAKYLRANAGELRGVAAVQLPALLGYDRLGVRVVGGKRGLCYRGVQILHGHELSHGSGTPRCPAKTALNKAFADILIGHHHVTDQYHENTRSGGLIRAWTTGCSCQLHPEYARVNRWNHGFAVLWPDGRRSARVENLFFRNGKRV